MAAARWDQRKSPLFGLLLPLAVGCPGLHVVVPGSAQPLGASMPGACWGPVVQVACGLPSAGASLVVRRRLAECMGVCVSDLVNYFDQSFSVFS